MAADESLRASLIRRALGLEYLTLVWNALEAIIAVVTGLFAGSIALIGFGFDSVIETSSGAVLLWRLSADEVHARREAAEQRALQFVGLSFFALAAYVAFEAVKTLFFRQAPHASYVGIGLAIASLVVMPLLARAKERVAVQISSRALHADSRQTSLCAYLSGILLGGLVLNALFGWWWADPVAGLAMTPIIAREGVEAFSGDACD